MARRSPHFSDRNASDSGGVLGMYSLFTGGALEQCAVGALGIMPYISATIIIQLLTAVFPPLSKLAREEGGRTKIIQYGRYLTVILCFIQGASWRSTGNIPKPCFRASASLVLYPDSFTVVLLFSNGSDADDRRRCC